MKQRAIIAQYLRDSSSLAASIRCSWSRDDRNFVEHDRRVLDKHGVRLIGCFGGMHNRRTQLAQRDFVRFMFAICRVQVDGEAFDVCALAVGE
jgi:hypothetical protein